MFLSFYFLFTLIAVLTYPMVHRICPGQHLAEPFLFLCIAMTLATFNITKERDEHGDVIEPELEWMSGTIRCETIWIFLIVLLNSVWLSDWDFAYFKVAPSRSSAESSLDLRRRPIWPDAWLRDYDIYNHLKMDSFSSW